MSEHRTMAIKVSRYDWNHFKDLMHFYFLVNLIPMFAFITYFNTTRGRAELRDIPEDYEPKHWEYYRHPISQLMARLFFTDPVKQYEMHLHNVERHNEIRLMRAYEKRAQLVMQLQGNTKGWYARPINTFKFFKAEEDHEKRST